MPSTSPWVTMLSHPRQGLSTVLDHPRFSTHVGFVLAVYIVTISLMSVVVTSRPESLVVFLFGGWIGFLVVFYVSNLLSLLTARALGGKSGWRGQQLALVWGLYPSVLINDVGGLFLSDSSPALLLWLSGLIGGGWSFGLTAFTLAAVHGLSFRRGLISAWPVPVSVILAFLSS